MVQVDVLVGEENRRDPFCDVLARSPLPRGDTSAVPVLGFMACAAMVRREDFLGVGGFDDVVRFPGEEERLSWDLAAAGRSLAYLPGPVVHHHPSQRRHDPFARQRRVARSRILSGALRLPWRDAVGRVGEEWRAGAARRRGVLDALADLPAAAVLARGRARGHRTHVRRLHLAEGEPPGVARWADERCRQRQRPSCESLSLNSVVAIAALWGCPRRNAVANLRACS